MSKENKSYFDGIKIRDRIFSLNLKWVTVLDIFTTENENKPIIEIYGHDPSITYFYDLHGFMCLPNGSIIDNNQTLFWDEVKIVPPRRPSKEKRKYNITLNDVNLDFPEQTNITNLKGNIISARFSCTTNLLTFLLGKSIRNDKITLKWEE